MNNKIDPCDTMRVNLIAAAVGLQQCTKTESNIVPIPGGDRVIAIGTPAQVRALLGAAPPNAAGIDLDKLEALARAARQERWEMIDQGGSIGLRVPSGYHLFVNTRWANDKVEAVARNIAAFIGALDPATVLQLIELARLSTRGSDVCAEMRALCANCGGTGDVHRADGEYIGECSCQLSASELTHQRAKFEAWGVRMDLFAPEAFERDIEGEYVSEHTNSLWVVWQASAQQASGSDGTAAAGAAGRTERDGWEAAAKALAERAAGHDRMGNFTEADECRTCVSMLHDMKPETGTATATSGSELAPHNEKKPPLPAPTEQTATGARRWDVTAMCNYGTECFIAGENAQARAALTQQPGAPAGYKLVPIEPTPEMLAAVYADGIWDNMDPPARVSWATMIKAAPAPAAQDERDAKDAARYRWLCTNNFDRPDVPQIQTWVHYWKPHTESSEPTEWKRRIRGGALDWVIDEAIAAMSQAKTQGTAGQDGAAC